METALKDLPNIANDLKSQLEGFSPDKLKNIDTQEKIILPTAEGICKLGNSFSVTFKTETNV